MSTHTPKELDLFKKFSGRFTARIEPADGSPAKEARWELSPVLGGAGYLETFEELTPGVNNKVCILWGFDAKEKKYTRTGINGSGEWATADGMWNGQEFTWNVNPQLRFVLSSQGHNVLIKAESPTNKQWTVAAQIFCNRI